MTCKSWTLVTDGSDRSEERDVRGRGVGHALTMVSHQTKGSS